MRKLYVLLLLLHGGALATYCQDNQPVQKALIAPNLTKDGQMPVQAGDVVTIRNNSTLRKRSSLFSKILKLTGIGAATYQSVQLTHGKDVATGKSPDLLLPLGIGAVITADKFFPGRSATRNIYIRYALYDKTGKLVENEMIPYKEQEAAKKQGVIVKKLIPEDGSVEISLVGRIIPEGLNLVTEIERPILKTTREIPEQVPEPYTPIFQQRAETIKTPLDQCSTHAPIIIPGIVPNLVPETASGEPVERTAASKANVAMQKRAIQTPEVPEAPYYTPESGTTLISKFLRSSLPHLTPKSSIPGDDRKRGEAPVPSPAIPPVIRIRARMGKYSLIDGEEEFPAIEPVMKGLDDDPSYTYSYSYYEGSYTDPCDVDPEGDLCYCEENPDDEMCNNSSDPCDSDPEGYDCYCQENPDDVMCDNSNNPCDSNPEGYDCYCQENPDDVMCDNSNDPCDSNPEGYDCYCQENPDDIICEDDDPCDLEPEGYDCYCQQNPSDETCCDPTSPESECYCDPNVNDQCNPCPTPNYDNQLNSEDPGYAPDGGTWYDYYDSENDQLDPDYLQGILNNLANDEGGGYENNPYDSGGPTKWGIDWDDWQRSAQAILNIAPTLENLANLTESQAQQIYLAEYYFGNNINSIFNGRIANTILNQNLQSGRQALVNVIRALNALGYSFPVSGGPLSQSVINALNNVDSIDFLDEFKSKMYTSLYNTFSKQHIAKAKKGTLTTSNDPCQNTQGSIDRVNRQ